MDIKELLDEDAFDPEKLFNEKEYSTLIINREGFSKKENLNADLIESLLDKELSRTECEEIFKKLKKGNSDKLLVQAIKDSAKVTDKTKLVTACWESGLDFSAHFLFFAELTCHPDFQLALEALSVVESTEGAIPSETTHAALEFARNAKKGHEHLINDLIKNLNLRLNA